MKESLTFLGCCTFIISLFLPMNVSIGGLTEAGASHSGFIGFFYSVGMIYGLLLESNHWANKREMLDAWLMAGLGLCNLAILLSPLSLWLPQKYQPWVRLLLTLSAIYICTIGFEIYRYFPLRYGHYIWCLSALIVALAQYFSARAGKRLLA